MFPQEQNPAEWFWPTPSGCLPHAKPEDTEVPSNLWHCLSDRVGPQAATGPNLKIPPEHTSLLSVLKSSHVYKSKHEQDNYIRY